MTATLPRITHPDLCCNAGQPVNCGDHLTPAVITPATADTEPGSVETAMVVTEAGVPGVYLAVTDCRDRSAFAMHTITEAWALIAALTEQTRRAEAYELRKAVAS